MKYYCVAGTAAGTGDLQVGKPTPEEGNTIPHREAEPQKWTVGYGELEFLSEAFSTACMFNYVHVLFL